MRQHRGNEVFIATNLKLRVVKYEYICHFYFFNKATILQLNLTMQRRALGIASRTFHRSDEHCFANDCIARFTINSHINYSKDGPPFFEER